MIGSLIKHIILILLFFFSINSVALACEGRELTETLQILHETLEVGYQAGLTGNTQGLLSKAQELSRRAQALSPSCQAIIEEVGTNLQNRYRRETTNCHGGVCCDGSGCVSN